MPGVAQPDYDQSGGSNNPTRAMAITVNGQPPSNTVVRLDGVTQINQFFQQIQAYSPSLEAIETVSVVTNSFDADQGMAGGASVNVQVKSGTNNLAGSLFDHATDYRMKSKNYFLPAGDPKGTGSVHVFGGTVGGPDRPQQILLLRQRGEHAPADDGRHRLVELGRERSSQSADDGDARGQFLRHGYGHLRSANWRRERLGPSAVCVCELRHHVDDRSAIRLVQLHSGEPHQPGLAEAARQAGCTDTAGIQSNYFATNKYDTDYRKYDGKLTWVPSDRMTVNGRLGYATATRTAPQRCRRIDGEHQSDLAGAHLGLHGPQSLAGGHPTFVARRWWWTACSALRARTCSPSRTPTTAGARRWDQEQLPAAAIARHGDSRR